MKKKPRLTEQVRTVYKNSNSLQMTIPSEFTKALEITNGTQVLCFVVDPVRDQLRQGDIVVRKIAVDR